MELKITSKTEKSFLGRKEFVLKGKSATTPSKVELKEEVAKLTSSAPELVVIKKVNQQFGRQDFEVSAYAYDNEKSFKEFEKEKKKKVEGAAA